MARAVRDVKLESRNGRLSLKQRQEPYWKTISQGLHIGYYKGSKSTSWIARYRSLTKSKYITAKLGSVDDVVESDGIKVLTFYEAQEHARSWHTDQIQIETGNRAATKNYTVDHALKDYVTWFKSEGRNATYTQQTIDYHISPHLGEIELKKLTTKLISDWRTKLIETPARIRTKANQPPAYKQLLNDPESIRKRKASANRTVTVLKAALNYAFSNGYAASDEAWKRIKPFQSVDNPIKDFLSVEECIRFMNACEQDFRQLVQAALFTGCRYSELGRLVSDDFDYKNGTCLIRESKNGKPRRVTLSDEGRSFFKNFTIGKSGSETIFLRANGGKWTKSVQTRRLNTALKNANITKNISFHGLRDTHASLLVEQGVSMTVIAHQFGSSDTRLIEKHYAHLRPSYASEVLRNNLPTFFASQSEKITALEIAPKKTKKLS